MAQAGYTPIQLYYSTTAAAVPVNTNLANGELAINVTDGKLFYKDNSNVVQVIGWKTVPATAGGTGLTSPGANGNVLTSNGSAWVSSAPAAQVYPGAGIPNSTGSAWGTSYSTTGSGTVVALATSPSFTTPTLGVASATSINKVALTAPATSATLTIADGKTLTANASLTLAGTDATTMTFPSSSATLAGLGISQTFTGTQTFNGSSSVISHVMANAAETATISATAATGTINYDVTTQSVLFYTTNASANWTVNLRGSSGTSMNTLLATGQSITVAFLVTQGATAYYNTTVQVDGATAGVTTRWQGGTAPTAGNASGVDVYTYTVVKTGSATFSVFASQTRFA